MHGYDWERLVVRIRHLTSITTGPVSLQSRYDVRLTNSLTYCVSIVLYEEEEEEKGQLKIIKER